jgi:single-stranded DNA-binding protein
MNNISVFGAYAGTEPEFRQIGETQVASFRLADNVSDDKVVWMTVSAWGAMADFVMENITKGTSISFTGSITKLTAYVSKDGEVAPSLDVSAVWITVGKASEKPKTASSEPSNRKSMSREEYLASRKKRATD